MKFNRISHFQAKSPSAAKKAGQNLITFVINAV
jgi:hypothetical protein